MYTNVYLMVLVQNKYKNTLVGVRRTQITFVMHSSSSCYVTLRTQVIRLNSGNLSPQKTDSGVFIILSLSSYKGYKKSSTDSVEKCLLLTAITAKFNGGRSPSGYLCLPVTRNISEGTKS